jgi:hypothetical protein
MLQLPSIQADPSARRSLVVVVRAIYDHVVQAKSVRSEGANGGRLPAIPLAAAIVAVGLVPADLITVPARAAYLNHPAV